MKTSDSVEKYLNKRVKAYNKYITARNNFLERQKNAREDLEECYRINKDLKDKLEWYGNIP